MLLAKGASLGLISFACVRKLKDQCDPALFFDAKGFLMGVYSRYVFRQTGGAVVMILATLMVIIWVSVALKDIKLMTSDGQTLGRFPQNDHVGDAADYRHCHADGTIDCLCS